MRRNPVAIGAMLIAFACIVVMTVFILDDARDDREQRKGIAKAQEAIELILEQRAESRLNTCLREKKAAEAHNKLVIGIVTQAGAREIPLELVDEVEEQLVTVPDCSPQGIKDFYEGQARETAEVPDGAVGEPGPSTTTSASVASTTRRRATTTTRPTSTTGSTTSTTFHSSPEPTDPCELLPGITVPKEIPCL